MFAFCDCEKIENVIIPASVKNIWRNAFERCSGLKSFVMSDSVTDIGDNAFNGCTSLTDLYYKGTEEMWNAINGKENIPETVKIHFSK